jgi:hypothetical protein
LTVWEKTGEPSLGEVTARQSGKGIEAADGMAQSSGMKHNVLLISGTFNKKMMPK